MKYGQVYDGEWIKPKTMRGHRMACCDCGLVHIMDFAVVKDGRKNVVMYRAARNNRATAARRRGLRRKLGEQRLPSEQLPSDSEAKKGTSGHAPDGQYRRAEGEAPQSVSSPISTTQLSEGRAVPSMQSTAPEVAGSIGHSSGEPFND